MSKKLVLALIDGLSSEALERGLGDRALPTLAALAEHGAYTRATSVFPSVTPVCLTSIATGAYPDRHGIPHLVWYQRDGPRVVEYGSSLAAVRATGLRSAVRDSAIDMAGQHVAADTLTVFEELEDAGLVTGAINFTCYRGRHRHRIRLPGARGSERWYASVVGPRRFFFFNLFESDAVGAPLAVRSRTHGSVDEYAVAAGRWLVTRDGFDFLVFYLPDYDYASHLAGPQGARAALERADACLARLFDAAGGLDAFLERYAIVVCADHGQTSVTRVERLEAAYADLSLLAPRRPQPERADVAVVASNRAGMVYRLPPCRLTDRELAERLDGSPAADVVCFREGRDAVARREREELRFSPGADGAWRTSGDPAVVDPERYPNALERIWHALACERAGDVLVSPPEGVELVDLGGRHHLGGGSHGSLVAGDSIVPVLAAGFDADSLAEATRIVDLKALALAHFGLAHEGSPAARAASA